MSKPVQAEEALAAIPGSGEDTKPKTGWPQMVFSVAFASDTLRSKSTA